jgi:predicted metal-dependent peptidase
MAITTAAEKISKARAALVIQFPFFGSLALRLRVLECDTIKTADVDGTTMRYNPAFIDGLSIAECAGLWAHETMHCALGHPWRIAGRDPRKWNHAADYAVNPILTESGCTLPKGGLNDPAFAGKSADEIYALLPDGQGGGKSGKPGNGNGEPADGEPGMGDVRMPDPAPGDVAVTPADAAQQERDWQVATIQAANAAKAAGNLPGALKRLVEEIKAPKVDWRAQLRRFVQSKFASDYRWSPPNRRYLHYGLYLPALKADGIGPVAVMVDTSGSIDAATLAAFAAEINAIVADAKPERVHVIYCDADVNGTAEYERDGGPIVLEPMGGGGTDFRPPFVWLAENDVHPCCAIYLTDLYGTFPDAAPDMPVLWAATSDAGAPFGEVIRIEA